MRYEVSFPPSLSLSLSLSFFSFWNSPGCVLRKVSMLQKLLVIVDVWPLS